MSSDEQPSETRAGTGNPVDDSTAVAKTSNNETAKKQAPITNKVSTEKLNKSSNMTVVTETVDTSSINILPISHDVLPKNTAKKETKIDDSDETFLYDNSLQGQFGQTQLVLPPLQLQVQLQASLNQRVASGLPPVNSTPNLVLSTNPSNINTITNNSNSNLTIANGTQAYVNGHSIKNNTTGQRKPRFTQRNSSFHSIHQANPEVDVSQHGATLFNPVVQENIGINGGGGGGGGASTHTTTESSIDFANNNMLLESNKYSDNDEDEDFDSSTYDTFLTTNKSNTSPTASKFSPARRVVSMKHTHSQLSNGWSQNLKGKPYSTLPQPVTDGAPPLLRTITSKLFDSKGTQPRRYSGLPPDIDFDDFDDDELEDYDFDSNNGHLGNTTVASASNRFGNDEADIGNEYKSLKNGKKQNYGSVNEFGDNGTFGNNSNGFRLKKYKRNNDLYYSPHNFPNTKGGRWRQFSSFCYTFLLILVLLLMGFISGFLLASTKDLQAVKIVDVSDVIISQEELVFNMIIDGFNPGFINIEIRDVEIEVFAKSSHVHDELYKVSSNDILYETVLLGSITELEIPLKFQGGFFSRQKNIATTEVKILNPCASDDDDTDEPPTTTTRRTSTTAPSTTLVTKTTTTTEIIKTIGDDTIYHVLKEKDLPPSPDQEKWHNISQHPFDLIIRGVLKYNLPILNEFKTVGVNKVVMIDPENLNL